MLALIALPIILVMAPVGALTGKPGKKINNADVSIPPAGLSF